MKKLAFVALALAATQAAGCIFVSEDSEGNFHASWTLTAGAAAITCTDAGVAKGEILSTDSAAQGYADRFPCADMEGTTGPLPEDDYTVVFSILDSADAAIESAAPEQAVIVGGDVTELGTYNFDFPPQTVQATIFIDYGAAGGMNCTETAAGGSGVVQQQIFLYDMGGSTCIDIAFTDPLGGPADTCGTTHVCTETNEGIQLQLDAGDYDIEVNGLKGAVGGSTYVCYIASTSFSISVDSDLDVLVPFDDTMFPTECNATKPSRDR